MKINFILPFKSLTGGIKVIFQYANQLQKRGHDVILVYPLLPYLRAKKRLSPRGIYQLVTDTIRNLKNGKSVTWFQLEARLVRVPWVSNTFLENSDVVIASSWQTAYSVYRLKPNKGKKAYFIQGYEIWGNVSKEKVDATWKMPLAKIVTSGWLKHKAEREFGVDAFGPLVCGVSLSQFYCKDKIFNKNKRIGMLYHTMELKGVKDGIRVFETARQEHPDIQLVMFGMKRGPDIPAYVEFHENPQQDKIREIYSSCDIWVSPSWTEGFGMPPMEAMACKCAVVATNVGGIPHYTIKDRTALVSKPRDIEAMSKNIIKLLNNSDELKRLSISGYNHIRQFTWEKSAKKLEEILYQIAQCSNTI